jgi:hypothetical protein
MVAATIPKCVFFGLRRVLHEWEAAGHLHGSDARNELELEWEPLPLQCHARGRAEAATLDLFPTGM